MNDPRLQASAMLHALHAQGAASDRAKQMMLYGQFVGSWQGSRIVHETAGRRRELAAEVYFDWVLEGRAVQDVWIARAPHDGRAVMYGTTLRVYDPAGDCWHITWIDPLTQSTMRMVGRKVGDDIVQECRGDDGRLRQWVFTEIAADAFHWISREQTDDAAGWNLRVEFFLHRRT
jgi:hypothetical protein